MSLRKRLVFGVATACAVGSVGALATGFTFGLFSATETSGTNSFAVGTVSVGLSTPASVTCDVTAMVPGDSSAGAPIGNTSDPTCTYNVKYTGTAPAWLGVDMTITNGETVLYDGSATGIQFYLADGTPTTYVTSTAPTAGTTYTQEDGTSATLPDSGVDNLLVSTSTATTNQAVHFSLDYALPEASGESYNGGSVTVTLTFHAVQSTGNALPGDCAAGAQCNAAGDGSTFAWS